MKRVFVEFRVEVPEDATEDEIGKWINYQLQGGRLYLPNRLAEHKWMPTGINLYRQKREDIPN